ncbi:MAG TPA: hypothetical protein VFW45_00885 [Candidatus Polarisedimenticolia bacterium]|nr:hypothetical protein [Candidatus Polarisedimenticolia bacterium]
MRIAFGLKAHSGWAALVALGEDGGQLRVADRRRLELVPEDEADWAKQPYHAAQGLSPGDARAMVRGGFAVTRKKALQEMTEAVKRAREARHEVAACAVLMGEPMPAWSIEEILAVHFRMHKAEGLLFRDVLVRAAAGCDLEVVAIPEKFLEEHAAKVLAAPADALREKLSALGKSAGPPWGKDQKDAALAAMVALHEKK